LTLLIPFSWSQSDRLVYYSWTVCCFSSWKNFIFYSFLLPFFRSNCFLKGFLCNRISLGIFASFFHSDILKYSNLKVFFLLFTRFHIFHAYFVAFVSCTLVLSIFYFTGQKEIMLNQNVRIKMFTNKSSGRSISSTLNARIFRTNVIYLVTCM